MKAKELKEILKNVDDDNPIGFYVIGAEWTDEYDINLGSPHVICSNGINDEGWVDFGFEIKSIFKSVRQNQNHLERLKKLEEKWQ